MSYFIKCSAAVVLFFGVNVLAAKVDYNSCSDLAYSERNSCLLDLSRKEAVTANDPDILHKSELGIDFHYSMFLEGTNYFREGQQFTTDLHPFWNWDWSSKSQLLVDFYVSKFNGTGNQDSGTVGWGRPGLGYKYKFAPSEKIFGDILFRIRLPIYEWKYEDRDADPYGQRDIWEMLIENSWRFETTNGNEWNTAVGIKYNTDRSYDVSCSDPGCGITSGRIDQRPVIAHLEAGYVWKNNWDIGVAFRTEQTVIQGRTQYLGTGDELRDFVSIASNSLSLSATNSITDTTHLRFLIVKSLIEKYYDRDYIDQNFESSIYGSNLGVGLSLWFDL